MTKIVKIPGNDPPLSNFKVENDVKFHHFDMLDYGLIIQSCNGSIISINKIAKQMFGSHLEEIVGKEKTRSDWKILREDGTEFQTDQLPSIVSFNTGEPNINVVVGIKKSGQKNTRWFLVSSFRQNSDEQSEQYQVFSLFKNITDYQVYKQKSKERNKVLQAFYALSNLAELNEKPLESIFKRFVQILPKSWQYPQITCCRLEILGKEYKSKNYQNTAWKQIAGITIDGNSSGELEIGYLISCSDEDEGPFLKEERFLINSVAERIGRIAERRLRNEIIDRDNEINKLAIQNAEFGIWRWDFSKDKIILDENAQNHYGFSKGEIRPKDFQNHIHPDDVEKVIAAYGFNGPGYYQNNFSIEYRVLHPDGKLKWLSVSTNLLQKETAVGFISISAIGISQDITKRKLADFILQQRTRALLLLSECNQTLGKISIENNLLQEICRICVENGGYQLAWVGYVDTTSQKKLKSVASFGEGDGHFDSADLLWDKSENSWGPTDTAIKTNRPCIVQDIKQDKRFPLWQKYSTENGFNSAIAFPIHVGWLTIGVLTLYSEESDKFQADEVTILTEIAKNISFGIESLRYRDNQILLEKALSKSEGRYKLAQESARIGSWEWDISNNDLYWSDEMFILFDKKKGEFAPTYSAMMACMVKEDRFRTAISFDSSIKEGTLFDVEFRIHDSLGGIKWINSKGNSKHDSMGNPNLVAGTMQDISARKNVESNLQKIDQNYKLISENTDDVIWVMDVESKKYTYVSPSIQKMLGYTPEDVMKESIGDVFIQDSLNKINDFLSQNIQLFLEGNSTSSVPIELEQMKKDGSIVCTEVIITIALNDYGKLQVIGISRDISERKRAEKALDEERNLFTVLMNTIPDGIYFKDKESRFIRINNAMADRLGLSKPSDALGKTDFDYFSEEHARPAFDDELNIIKTESPIINKEEEETWDDGNRFWVLTSKLPLKNNDGQIIGTFGISHDITHRKMTEASLRESEERFKSFYENAADAILLTSPDGTIFTANPAARKMFGWTEQEMVEGGRDLLVDLTDVRLKPAINERQTKGLAQVDLTFKKKDGTHFEGELTSAIYLDKDRNEKSVMIIRDITRRKQMENALQQRVMELETVSQLSARVRTGETVKELIQILLDETLKTIDTPDGAIFLLNPSTHKLELAAARGWFSKLSGLVLESIEGINGHVFSTKKFFITSDMRSDKFLAQKVKQIIPQHQCGGFFPLVCSEGIIGVIDVFVPLPRLINENEQRLLTIISQLAGNAILRSRLNETIKQKNINLQEEINQRVAFQSMLASEKELLSTTLMSIGEGVIITDREGLIVLFNRSAETITGFEIQEILGKPLDDVFQVFDPNTHKIVPDLIQNLYEMSRIQENEPAYKAPMLVTKSGERILITGSISVLKSPDGEMMGHVVAFQDVTEKQKAEAQSTLSQKMEAIGQLAAGIAHEINTPIQYVGDNLRFLQKTVTKFSEVVDAYKQIVSEQGRCITREEIDSLNELNRQTKIQHYLSESPNAVQEALDGVERVRKIVLAMREFSHPSEKEKKLADINHGIETTIVISRNEWKYFTELETDLDPTLPMVYCQIDEINQVVLNMIINAVQSIQDVIPPGSDQKGKITISTQAGNDRVLINVQDTGKGIPEDIQQRIFDPFFTTKGVGKGTGQGLSLAHQIIVQKHHGKISVDSAVGIGSTFTIELPIGLPEKES